MLLSTQMYVWYAYLCMFGDDGSICSKLRYENSQSRSNVSLMLWRARAWTYSCWRPSRRCEVIEARSKVMAGHLLAMAASAPQFKFPSNPTST